MIEIDSSVQRTFTFPATLEMAFNYFADMDRTLNMLPHISLLQRYDDLKYRVVFNTTELGIYQIRIICDLGAKLDQQNMTLFISPLEDITPVHNEVGMYSLSAYGYYSSESHFVQAGNQTKIDYKLKLNARLPIPFGVRLMPKSVLNGITRSITQRRIFETVEGFIERSIYNFNPSIGNPGVN